jgi:hypothetical protein
MYRVSRKQIVTKEEKAAIAMGKILSDFYLDLEKVGYYLAKSVPYLIYKRALSVLESAQFQEDTVEHEKLKYDQRRLP